MTPALIGYINSLFLTPEYIKHIIEHTIEHQIILRTRLPQYPFHLQFVVLGTTSAIMASQGSTLDMSLFFGTAEQKQHFCHELLRLLKRYGCVKIQNHSIPDGDVHKLFEMVCDTSFTYNVLDTMLTKSQTKKFFELPLEDKMKAKRPAQANPNRGYSYVGQENVANISGYEKGKGPNKTRDIKVSTHWRPNPRCTG